VWKLAYMVFPFVVICWYQYLDGWEVSVLNFCHLCYEFNYETVLVNCSNFVKLNSVYTINNANS